MRILIAATSRARGLRGASAQTINVATAGDQNMVDYVRDYLGPLFEKKHPGVKVVAVGTADRDHLHARMLLLEQRTEIVAHIVDHVLVSGRGDIDSLGAGAAQAARPARGSDEYAHGTSL